MLVIFDCDGVLIDSEAIFCAVDAEALTNLGYPTSTSTISERFAGIPHRIAWQRLAEEHGLNLPDSWVDEILRECDRRFASDLKAIAGAPETIAEIKNSGHKVCVASSTELAALVNNLERTGVFAHVTSNVFSVSQVKRSKPAPDVFLFAASQMGFDPSDCLVVEDSVAGVMAATRAGMRSIGFIGGGHAYPSLPARLSGAGAASICSSMAEIRDVIGSIDKPSPTGTKAELLLTGRSK
ncbi:HAD family hydrolase (plasmid) [Rhizobium leguminosarum]|jgi:HAD superfamily hydrolase (TIGR01509 family)